MVLKQKYVVIIYLQFVIVYLFYMVTNTRKIGFFLRVNTSEPDAIHIIMMINVFFIK